MGDLFGYLLVIGELRNFLESLLLLHPCSVGWLGFFFFFFFNACYDRGAPLFFLNTTPRFGSSRPTSPELLILEKHKAATTG